MDSTILVPILGFAGSVIVTLIGAFFARRERKALAEKTIVDSAGVVIDKSINIMKKYEERIDCLEKEQDEMVLKMIELNEKILAGRLIQRRFIRGINLLVAQLVEADMKPVWLPTESDIEVTEG